MGFASNLGGLGSALYGTWPVWPMGAGRVSLWGGDNPIVRVVLVGGVVVLVIVL
jgi:hypothetical protein